MQILIKILIVVMLLTVIYNLFKAMFSMLKGDKNAPPMTHFIGRRLIFAGGLLFLLVVLVGTGVIEVNPNPYMRR
jgi:hypothetical protein